MMKPLPPSLLAGYQELSVRVSSHSLVRVRNRTYSVPARLAGFTLRAQVHESEVQLFLGREEVLLPHARFQRTSPQTQRRGGGLR